MKILLKVGKDIFITYIVYSISQIYLSTSRKIKVHYQILKNQH